MRVHVLHLIEGQQRVGATLSAAFHVQLQKETAAAKSEQRAGPAKGDFGNQPLVEEEETQQTPFAP